MPLWLQHLLVLSLAAFSLFIVVRQGIQSLRGKATRIGSCCDQGCGLSASSAQRNPSERLVFLPSDMLRKNTSLRELREAQKSQ